MKLVEWDYDPETETVEDIGDGYRVIQKMDAFRFGTDAVKLADFAVIKPGERIMDLCTGTAIIPLLLHKKQKNIKITALELQEEIFDLATRTVKANNLTEDINVCLGDVKEVKNSFAAESFQVVTCNPPYMKNNTGKQNESETIRISRHELCCDLYDCIDAAAYLLQTGGRFYMVHRPERLAEIITAMSQAKLEPKRLTFYGNYHKSPRLLVIEGQKNRNSGIIVNFEAGDTV